MKSHALIQCQWSVSTCPTLSLGPLSVAQRLAPPYASRVSDEHLALPNDQRRAKKMMTRVGLELFGC